jgi:ATP-dependent Clp protease adaptor protein ClpS
LKKNLSASQSLLSKINLDPMATRHREGIALATKKAVAKLPPLYKVLLLNDDYTPMDFVVKVLEQIFHLGREQATLVMLKVHNEGVGVAGVYPRDVAETKVSQVLAYARSHQHPLQCVTEESR